MAKKRKTAPRSERKVGEYGITKADFDNGLVSVSFVIHRKRTKERGTIRDLRVLKRFVDQLLDETRGGSDGAGG